MAHTIRNPLAGMRASAQQASIELADHPVTELVDAFVRETDRLSSRIDSLLDFARPFHVGSVATSLGEIARRAAEQVRGRARERRITIDESRVCDDARAMVDPVLFEQLTVELIANAVDASPTGGTVTLATSRGVGASWLEVRDEGPGIPADRRERMFRMFFTTKAKGTGIGLATVKRIADAHHATIEVRDAWETCDAGDARGADAASRLRGASAAGNVGASAAGNVGASAAGNVGASAAREGDAREASPAGRTGACFRVTVRDRDQASYLDNR